MEGGGARARRTVGAAPRRPARGRRAGGAGGPGEGRLPAPQSDETVRPTSRMLSAFSCITSYCLGQVRFFVLNDLPCG